MQGNWEEYATVVTSSAGGFFKQQLTIGPEALYWVATPQNSTDWPNYCFYAFIIGNDSVEGQVKTLYCNFTDPSVSIHPRSLQTMQKMLT